MYLDAFAEFADSQAVTASAISNVMDLGPLGGSQLIRDIGLGEPIWLIVLTNVTCTDSGSDATLTVSLESDDNVGLTSATVHATTVAIAFATFATAGSTVWAIRIPPGAYERYLGVRFTVASGPLTAGAFDAFLTKDYSSYRAYARNYTITG